MCFSQQEHQSKMHKCHDINRSTSNTTHHDTLLGQSVQCTMPLQKCADQQIWKRRKKKRHGLSCERDKPWLSFCMGEGGEGTLLVDSTRDSRRVPLLAVALTSWWYGKRTLPPPIINRYETLFWYNDPCKNFQSIIKIFNGAW